MPYTSGAILAMGHGIRRPPPFDMFKKIFLTKYKLIYVFKPI